MRLYDVLYYTIGIALSVIYLLCSIQAYIIYNHKHVHTASIKAYYLHIVIHILLYYVYITIQYTIYMQYTV